MENSKYKILGSNIFQLDEYSLVPIRKEDMFSIMHWRNEQINILRQKKPLSKNDQILYFEKSVWPTFAQEEPKTMLFSFLENDNCIGYGGLTNIDWESKRVELAFLLNTFFNQNIEQFKSRFKVYLKLYKRIVFKEMNFNRIFSETFDIRPYVIEVLEECDFKEEGRMIKHNIINGVFVDSVIHGCINPEYDL